MLNLQLCKPEAFDDAIKRLAKERTMVPIDMWRAAIESAIGAIKASKCCEDCCENRESLLWELEKLSDARRP